jgi:hypothetical protein
VVFRAIVAIVALVSYMVVKALLQYTFGALITFIAFFAIVAHIAPIALTVRLVLLTLLAFIF